MDIRPAKKQELGKIMTLKSYMDKQRAAAERKEKRQAKALYLWPSPKRAKYVKKTPRQLLRAKLDNLWSTLVRRRDSKKTSGFCMICLNRPIEAGYHLVPRSDDSIRWDPQAGVGSCHACNYGEMRSRHRYREIHIKIFGREFIEKLEAKARITVHFSMADLEEIKIKLTRMIQTGSYE